MGKHAEKEFSILRRRSLYWLENGKRQSQKKEKSFSAIKIRLEQFSYKKMEMWSSTMTTLKSIREK